MNVNLIWSELKTFIIWMLFTATNEAIPFEGTSVDGEKEKTNVVKHANMTVA